jgi:hypothetical protein
VLMISRRLLVLAMVCSAAVQSHVKYTIWGSSGCAEVESGSAEVDCGQVNVRDCGQVNVRDARTDCLAC